MPRLTRLLVVLSFTVSVSSLVAGCTAGGGIPARDAGPLRDAAAFSDAGPRPPHDAGDELDSVLIYAHSDNTLYAFSPFTNAVTEIGVFKNTDGSDAVEINDLAVDADGFAFVCGEDGFLYALDVTTAVITEIGDLELAEEDHIFGLSFIAPGESPDGTEMLMGASNDGVYFEIDRATAETTELGRYPNGWGSSGDIVSVEGLGTYATIRRNDVEGDVLALIEFTASGASAVTELGAIREGSTVFRQIFGLAYWGRDVYGFDNDGQLIRIDKNNGRATVVADDTGADRFWGAGVTTRVPFLF